MQVGREIRVECGDRPGVPDGRYTFLQSTVKSMARQMALASVRLSHANNPQPSSELQQTRRAWTRWLEQGPQSERVARLQACQRLEQCLKNRLNVLDLFDLPISTPPPLEHLPSLPVPKLMIAATQVSGVNPWKDLPGIKVILPQGLTQLSEMLAPPARWLIQRFLQRLDSNALHTLAGQGTTRIVNPDASPQQLAGALLRTVRDDIYRRGFKSSNKLRQGDPHAAPEKAAWRQLRTDLAESALVLFRQKYVQFDQNFTWALFNSKGQNCAELSKAALSILNFSGYSQCCEINFVAEDHNVLLIGTAYLQKTTTLAELPADFSICDPWANIACGVHEYEARYCAKMNKWAAQGKQIFDVFDQTWKAPNHDDPGSRIQKGIEKLSESMGGS